jgi:hypothetical protein
MSEQAKKPSDHKEAPQSPPKPATVTVLKRENVSPSQAQEQAKKDKEEGRRPELSGNTMTQREFEARGQGQTLDALKDSAESKQEQQRRERNNEPIGGEWVDPRGKYEGADDSEPESGEFDDEKGSADMKDRKKFDVATQQRRDYEFHRSQMLKTEEGMPSAAQKPVEQKETTTELNTKREETQRRGK